MILFRSEKGYSMYSSTGYCCMTGFLYTEQNAWCKHVQYICSQVLLCQTVNCPHFKYLKLMRIKVYLFALALRCRFSRATWLGTLIKLPVQICELNHDVNQIKLNWLSRPYAFITRIILHVSIRVPRCSYIHILENTAVFLGWQHCVIWQIV